jgi:hypothetical protein
MDYKTLAFGSHIHGRTGRRILLYLGRFDGHLVVTVDGQYIEIPRYQVDVSYILIVKIWLLIVLPDMASFLRYLIITTEVKLSIPVVGSSIITTGGFEIIS